MFRNNTFYFNNTQAPAAENGYESNEAGESGEGELQPLYGLSVDVTIAAAVGYTIEFGEICDPNTGGTQQFITNGPAFGVEATASY